MPQSQNPTVLAPRVLRLGLAGAGGGVGAAGEEMRAQVPQPGSVGGPHPLCLLTRIIQGADNRRHGCVMGVEEGYKVDGCTPS